MENSTLETFLKREDKERKVIFLDIDGVLQPGTQYRFDHDLDKTKEMLSKKYNNKNILLLDKYDVGAVYYDWSHDAVEKLKKLLFLTSADIVISSDWRCHRSLDELRLLFSLHDLDGYIVDGTPDLNYKREKEINTYLENHKDIISYVVLDDMSSIKRYFVDNMVCTNRRFVLNYSSMQEARRILDIGAWWSDGYEQKLKKVTSDDGVVHDYYENVIFLNIDPSCYICDIYKESLRYIMKKYDAEYVLCSLYEKNIIEYRKEIDANYDYEDRVAFEMMNFIFPESFSGVVSSDESANSYKKIKSWLKKRPYIKNYIIMSNEKNVKWRDLSSRVVDITKKQLDELEYRIDGNWREKGEDMEIFANRILEKMNMIK